MATNLTIAVTVLFELGISITRVLFRRAQIKNVAIDTVTQATATNATPPSCVRLIEGAGVLIDMETSVGVINWGRLDVKGNSVAPPAEAGDLKESYRYC